MIERRELKALGAMVLVGVMLLGCGGGPKQPPAMKVVKLPPAPPAVPPVKNEPLDPQLVHVARQEIRLAYESSDPVLRANAIEAAQSVADSDARDLILRGLRDGDPLVRFAASMSAGQLRLRDAYKPLLRLVFDPDPSVQIGVRYALHRLGDKRFTRGLEETARHPDRYIRGQTVMVLGMLNEPSAMKILRQMFNDNEAIVRLQVAEAMWRLGDEQGLASLAAASVSHFPDDQVFAMLAMAAPRDRRVLEHMRGKLTSDYTEISLAAARAMGELGSDEGYGVALKGVRGDARQKAMAAMAFGAIGRSDAQGYLAGLLKDSDAAVRLAAATGVLQLGKSATAQAQ